MKTRDIALGVRVAFIWGFNFIVIQEGLSAAPPLLFVAVRFAIVALLAFVVPRPKAPLAWVFGAGLFMAAGQFGFLYLAIAAGMPAGIASLVAQIAVPLTIVLAIIMFRERVSVSRIIGVVIALIGLAIVVTGRGEHATLLGMLLTVLSAVSAAIGNVLSRKAAAGGLSMVVWSSIAAPLPLFVASFFVEGPEQWALMAETWGWTQAWSTAYTVIISTLVGFGLWNSLLARYPASNVAVFPLFVPVAAVVSAAVAYQEFPTPVILLGGTILLAGAAIALIPDRRAKMRDSRTKTDAANAADDDAIEAVVEQPSS